MRRYKKTIIGSSLLLLLLLMSFLYPYYGPKDYNHQTLAKDEQGNVIGRAPFPPSSDHWLGTNRNGEDMHWLLLFGAKFTLSAAFGVSFLRVLIGGILGIFMSLWVPHLKSYFKDFFLTFHYIPSILLGIILMAPIAGGFDVTISIFSRVSYQMIILVFIGIPSVVLFASDITDEILKSSFVQSSYLLGGSKFHVLKRQLFPFIRSYSILFTVQQLLSTLHLTMQLGIFGIFLGGLDQAGVLGYDRPPKPASLSHEWAGLIGQSFADFNVAPWVALVPAFAYFFVIMVVNIMKKEIEDNLSGLRVINMKRKPKKDTLVRANLPVNSQFEFVENRKL